MKHVFGCFKEVFSMSFICLLLFVTFFTMASKANAQIADTWTTRVTTFKDAALGVDNKPPSTSVNGCPVYANTPMAEVERYPWEVSFRLNALDFPSGADAQVHLQNFDVVVIHNFSKQLFAYLWMGTRNIEKTDYEGSAYAAKWETQSVFAGVGLYVTPIIKVFAGGGKVWAKDDNDEEPDLETGLERGFAMDIPALGNKIEISYRWIDAKLKDASDKDVSEMTGGQNYNVFAISYTVGFDWK